MKVTKIARKNARKHEPTVIWLSKTGVMYRTLVDAKIDNPAKAWSTVLAPETKDVAGGTNTAAPGGKKHNPVLVVLLVLLMVFILVKILK
ncbi:MAG TPA: hypothetical protein VK152_11590 [Paludibacter sp.]|nr:hypothetical protein [Paludibacter sp.]